MRWLWHSSSGGNWRGTPSAGGIRASDGAACPDAATNGDAAAGDDATADGDAAARDDATSDGDAAAGDADESRHAGMQYMNQVTAGRPPPSQM